jgi:hypothetical protein
MIRGWLVVLALLSAVPALAKDPIGAFFDAGYNTCQADLLAKVWQTDLDQAKTRAGQALLEGKQQAIEDALNVVRHGGQPPTGWTACAYHEYGYSYEDAERVAAAWSLSVEDAKAKIEGGLWYGTMDTVMAGVGGVDQPMGGLDEKLQYQAVDVFFMEGYSYCDASVIAATWGNDDTWAAKVGLGTRLMEGDRKGVDKELKKARKVQAKNGFECDYAQIGISWEMVEALASAWGTDTSEAKSIIGTRMARGQSAWVFKQMDKVAPASP